MSAFRAVLLALLVAGTVAVLVPTAATAADASGATGDATLDATVAQNETANGSSLGADISSFMQSNAAEVDGAVETGMWTAAYNDTENRTVRVRLVERRTDDLRAEVADLSERKQELADAREAGEVSDAAYRARVGRIVGRIDALESAIDVTENRARQVNAGVENVTGLRTQTEELAGPEIASVARNLSGVGAGERGPPTDVGNETGASDGDGTGADDGSENGVGEQGDHNPGDGNDTDETPGNGPDDRAGRSDGGNGDDAASGGNAATPTPDGTAGNAG